MYSTSARVRVTVKLAFLVPSFLSCLSHVSFLDFEGGTAASYHLDLFTCIRAMDSAVFYGL